MADFGLSKGLTFKIPASEYVNREIEDMKYAAQMQRQQEAMDMAKAKMLSDDFNLIVGSNPVDAEALRVGWQETATKLGEITNRNRNWHTDPNALMQIQSLKNAYNSSDAMLRSVVHKQSMDNYLKWKQEVAKNPTRYNNDDLVAFENEMKSYDGSKPLVFTPPRELPDLNAIELDAATKMDPDSYQKWNNGNIGAIMGKVSDERVFITASSIYENNRSAYDYNNKGKSPDEIKLEIAKKIASNTKTDVHFGTPDTFGRELSLERAKLQMKEALKAQEKGGSLFDNAVLNRARTDFGDEIMSQLFTRNAPSFYFTPNGGKKENRDDEFYFDGPLVDKGVKFNDKGDAIGGQITGLKQAKGYYLKPVEWAVENGYAENPFFGDIKVKDDQKGKGEIIEKTTSDGKKVQLFKLNAVAEIDARNPVYKARMDKGMSPKLRAEAGVDTELESPTMLEYTDKKTGKVFYLPKQ